jgi:hypothetical protein
MIAPRIANEGQIVALLAELFDTHQHSPARSSHGREIVGNPVHTSHAR